MKRSHIDNLIAISPQHWLFLEGQGYGRRRFQAMWNHILRGWYSKMQHKLDATAQAWRMDQSRVQSMLVSERVADIEFSGGTLSAPEIRLQHERVVLSHLQNGMVVS